MLRTLPPVVKLKCLDSDVTVSPGEEHATFRFRLERTKNFDGPMRIELLEPTSSRITAEPIHIAAAESSGSMVIQIGEGFDCSRDVLFRFRATGLLNGKTQLISEATARLAMRRVGNDEH